MEEHCRHCFIRTFPGTPSASRRPVPVLLQSVLTGLDPGRDRISWISAIPAHSRPIRARTEKSGTGLVWLDGSSSPQRPENDTGNFEGCAIAAGSGCDIHTAARIPEPSFRETVPPAGYRPPSGKRILLARSRRYIPAGIRIGIRHAYSIIGSKI